MTNRYHSTHSRSNTQKQESTTWVGCSCGRHGSYCFYKAFRFRMAPDMWRADTTDKTRNVRSSERRNASRSEDDVSSSETCADQQQHQTPEGEDRILALGDFFFVQCRAEDPICVGELQLLWHDKHSGQDLSSTRLYYLPDATPAGRISTHGEDEMVAVSEKIVMRTADLASWVIEPEEWNYGCAPLIAPSMTINGGSIHLTDSPLHRYSLLHSSVNMTDVNAEKISLASKACAAMHGDDTSDSPTSSGKIGCCDRCADRLASAPRVLMLSAGAYYRHKAIARRIDGVDPRWLARPGVGDFLAALGAYTSVRGHERIAFCRDTFDYPQLFEHELICEELAPVFKGRPRKKLKKGGLAPLLGGGKSMDKRLASCTLRSVAVNETSDEVTSSQQQNDDDNVAGRRSSSRRRRKRNSPPSYAYDLMEYSAAAWQQRGQTKRSRRNGTTPTPSSVADTSPLPARSDSFTPPSGDEARTTATTAKRSKVELRRRGVKRRGGGKRSSALSIALRNSLLDIGGVDRTEPPQREQKDNDADDKSDRDDRSSPSSSVSSQSSSSSSRSSSPNDVTQPSVDDDKSQDAKSRVSSATTVGSSERADGISPSPSPVELSTAIAAEAASAPVTPGIENEPKWESAHSTILDDRSAFIDFLERFMRRRNTPIVRVPSLGFKKLDLWTFYKLSQELGGYDMITAKRLWKHVYDRMGGNPSCTSAATCTRKHYEKLLLPLEEYLRVERRPNDDAEKMPAVDDNAVCSSSKIKHKPGKCASELKEWNTDENVPPTTPDSIPSTSPLDNNKKDARSSCSPELLSNKSWTKTPGSSAAEESSLSPFTIREFESFESDAKTPTNCKSEVESQPEDLSMSRSSKSASPATAADTKQKTCADGKPHAASDAKSLDVTDASGYRAKTQSLPLANVPNTCHKPLAIRSRTHCPRMAVFPPPFVPTKSLYHFHLLQQRHHSATVNRATADRHSKMTSAQRHQMDRPLAASSFHRDQHREYPISVDLSNRIMQKRAAQHPPGHKFADRSTNGSLESDTKRSRVAASEDSSQHHHHHHHRQPPRMFSNVSTAASGATDEGAALRKPAHRHHQSSAIVASLADRQASTAAVIEQFHTAAEVAKVDEQRHRWRHHHHNLHPATANSHSAALPQYHRNEDRDSSARASEANRGGQHKHFRLQPENSRHNGFTTGEAKAPPIRNVPSKLSSSHERSSFHAPPPKSQDQQRETYYRPNGMLATHREAAKQQQKTQDQPPQSKFGEPPQPSDSSQQKLPSEKNKPTSAAASDAKPRKFNIDSIPTGLLHPGIPALLNCGDCPTIPKAFSMLSGATERASSSSDASATTTTDSFSSSSSFSIANLTARCCGAHAQTSTRSVTTSRLKPSEFMLSSQADRQQHARQPRPYFVDGAKEKTQKSAPISASMVHPLHRPPFVASASPLSSRYATSSSHSSAHNRDVSPAFKLSASTPNNATLKTVLAAEAFAQHQQLAAARQSSHSPHHVGSRAMYNLTSHAISNPAQPSRPTAADSLSAAQQIPHRGNSTLPNPSSNSSYHRHQHPLSAVPTRRDISPSHAVTHQDHQAAAAAELARTAMLSSQHHAVPAFSALAATNPLLMYQVYAQMQIRQPPMVSLSEMRARDTINDVKHPRAARSDKLPSSHRPAQPGGTAGDVARQRPFLDSAIAPNLTPEAAAILGFPYRT